MSKHLKHSYDDLEQFFSAPPTANQKAWGLLNQFYHLLLTYMENREIKKADLAKRLGRSRAAISQMFNKTPNISIRKMVEIADAVGLEFEIVPKEKQRDIAIHDEKKWGVPIPAPTWHVLVHSSGARWFSLSHIAETSIVVQTTQDQIENLTEQELANAAS